MARNFGHLRGGGALISDSARECSLHVGFLCSKLKKKTKKTIDDGRQFSVERVLTSRRSKDADVRDLNILIFYLTYKAAN
jgi:hypothetical protein